MRAHVFFTLPSSMVTKSQKGVVRGQTSYTAILFTRSHRRDYDWVVVGSLHAPSMNCKISYGNNVYFRRNVLVAARCWIVDFRRLIS